MKTGGVLELASCLRKNSERLFLVEGALGEQLVEELASTKALLRPHSRVYAELAEEPDEEPSAQARLPRLPRRPRAKGIFATHLS